MAKTVKCANRAARRNLTITAVKQQQKPQQQQQQQKALSAECKSCQIEKKENSNKRTWQRATVAIAKECKSVM